MVYRGRCFRSLVHTASNGHLGQQAGIASPSCCPAIDLFRIDPFHGNTIAMAKCSCSMQMRLCWECSLGRYRREQRQRLPLVFSCFVLCILVPLLCAMHPATMDGQLSTGLCRVHNVDPWVLLGLCRNTFIVPKEDKAEAITHSATSSSSC